MRLVAVKALELDAPVTRYTPWFTLSAAGVGDRVTVRMLTHTSGLSNDTVPWGKRDAHALEEYVRTRVARSWHPLSLQQWPEEIPSRRPHHVLHRVAGELSGTERPASWLAPPPNTHPGAASQRGGQYHYRREASEGTTGHLMRPVRLAISPIVESLKEV